MTRCDSLSLFGFSQFQPGWGIMGAYSLMQRTPRRTGYFFEGQGYGDFFRLTVRAFGLATSQRPIYGFSFGLGGRF